MFGDLFRKKPVKAIEQPTDSIEVLGEVQGSGVGALRTEIAMRLLRFPDVSNAYLAKLKYKGEEASRISLAIETQTISETQKQEIALGCSDVIAMDIVFLNALPSALRTALTTQCSPLIVQDMKLFECPIVVGRGSNTEMPSEWKGAIICFFVAAPDHEKALMVAVAQLRSEGYEFKTVQDERVNLLDPSKWWSGYVMERWSAYASNFPSQDKMRAIVATGGYFKGPALGWEHESKT